MTPRPRQQQIPIRVWSQAAGRDDVRLTGVRPVRDDPGCVWIILDGQRAGLVDRASAASLRLESAAADQKPWDPAWHDHLDAQVRERLCKRSGERLLAARMRCKAGLVRALMNRGHARPDAEACAAHFESLGALDDARYAEVLVRNELSRRPAGRRLLEAKLRSHGVPQSLAESAIKDALLDRDEEADARSVAESAARSLRPGCDPQAARRRIAGRLARRGFGPETIRRVLDSVLNGAAR
ncbi:MAG: RecX family transcriptional regulator [Phycisphaerales bacterium]|nr:regulatory protein RecX [Planctomycetota bacterium]MCH8507922.1 RecX family transcriptional regulator [Phycisphaerales bacterium]